MDGIVKSGIYGIRNKTNGKYYVGSAVKLICRINQHKHFLRRNNHHSKKLQNSWNKHGEAAFEFIILELVDNKEHLIMREQHWINWFDSYNAGYNSVPIAGSNLGMKASAETRAKLCLARKDVKYTPERNKKISDALTGRKFTEAHKSKISIIAKNRSEETRKKIGLKHKGKVISVATRQKMSVAQTGRKHSAETRAKMSAWQVGRTLSDETRRKISSTKTGVTKCKTGQ